MPVQLQINSAIRAYNFDALLRKITKQHPNATIVNIGAGLNTTLRRIDNGKIFRYDLDVPDSIVLRQQLIPDGPAEQGHSKISF
jgi:O-methyltransferase involved in polyketide biosynthesis